MDKGKKRQAERQYADEAFHNAVTAVKSGNLTCGQAAKLYGVPKTTVWLHVKKCRQSGSEPSLQKLGAQFTLNDKEERSLAAYMRWCESVSIPFTYELLKLFAGEILSMRGEGKKLCQKWARKFAKRHNFSSKKPRHIPRDREQAYGDPDNILHYFAMLQDQLKNLDLLAKPHCVWNVDEKGWSKEQNLQRPVLCTIGNQQAKTRQIFLNHHITTVHAINASGKTIPPYVIFSKNLPNNMVVSALPDAWDFGSSDSGFLNKELFFLWFKKTFLPNIGNERPQLLIYDAASCHISLEIVQLAMKEDIGIITLPGKTTAFLQPVDQILSNLVSAFADIAFQLSFMKADFLVRPANFAPVLHQAIQKAWTKDIIEYSFRKTGVFPPSLLEISKSSQLSQECREKLQRTVYNDDSIPASTTASPELIHNEEDTVQDITEECTVEYCPCGRVIGDPCLHCIHRYKLEHNPLLKSGVIPDCLSNLLDATAKKVPGKSNLSRAKHVTKQDMAHELEDRLKKRMEKEKLRLQKEEVKKQREVLRQEKEAKKLQRTKRKGGNQEKETTELDLPTIEVPKKRRQIRIPDTVSGTRSSDRVMRRLDYSRLNSGDGSEGNDICPACRIAASPAEDELLNVIWYGCDYCPRWWHRHCLSGNIQTNADLSVIDSTTQFRCPACPEQAVCCACLGSVSNIAAAQCYICLAQYHINCMPAETQINYTVLLELGQNWYCGKCSEE